VHHLQLGEQLQLLTSTNSLHFRILRPSSGRLGKNIISFPEEVGKRLYKIILFQTKTKDHNLKYTYTSEQIILTVLMEKVELRHSQKLFL